MKRSDRKFIVGVIRNGDREFDLEYIMSRLGDSDKDNTNFKWKEEFFFLKLSIG